MRLKKKMKKFKWFLEISVKVLIYTLIISGNYNKGIYKNFYTNF